MQNEDQENCEIEQRYGSTVSKKLDSKKFSFKRVNWSVHMCILENVYAQETPTKISGLENWCEHTAFFYILFFFVRYCFQ